MILIVANTCLCLGAAIKFLNVVLLEKDQEENYREPDAQAEQCLTGVGNIERKSIYLFLNSLHAGLMLFFVSNLYWFQLNSTLGPIATTMHKVISDIMMVGYAYAVFFFASAAAFHLILNKVVFGTENCDDEVRKE